VRLSTHGSAYDGFPYAIIILFAVCMFFPIYGVMTATTGAKFTEMGISDEVNAFNPTDRAKFNRTVDIIPMVIFLSLTGVGAFLAYLNPSAPVLIMFFIFFLIFAIMFSVFLSNAYEKFYNSTANITNAVDELPKQKHLMDNLPKYALLSTAVIVTILLSKWMVAQ